MQGASDEHESRRSALVAALVCAGVEPTDAQTLLFAQRQHLDFVSHEAGRPALTAAMVATEIIRRRDFDAALSSAGTLNVTRYEKLAGEAFAHGAFATSSAMELIEALRKRQSVMEATSLRQRAADEAIRESGLTSIVSLPRLHGLIADFVHGAHGAAATVESLIEAILSAPLTPDEQRDAMEATYNSVAPNAFATCGDYDFALGVGLEAAGGADKAAHIASLVDRKRGKKNRCIELHCTNMHPAGCPSGVCSTHRALCQNDDCPRHRSYRNDALVSELNLQLRGNAQSQ